MQICSKILRNYHIWNKYTLYTQKVVCHKWKSDIFCNYIDFQWKKELPLKFPFFTDKEIYGKIKWNRKQQMIQKNVSSSSEPDRQQHVLLNHLGDENSNCYPLPLVTKINYLEHFWLCLNLHDSHFLKSCKLVTFQ